MQGKGSLQGEVVREVTGKGKGRERNNTKEGQGTTRIWFALDYC